MELFATLLHYKLENCNFVAIMNNHLHQTETLRPYHRITNRLGIALSMLCAIHCLATPFLAVSLPFLGTYFDTNPWLEYVLLGSGLVFGGGITVHNYINHHHNLPVLLVVISGFSFLLIAHFFHGHWFETPIIILGAVMVAFGLYFNHKYANSVCKTCKVPHTH
jgi:hypothetical protein